MFHCFSCGVGGGVVKFVELKEGVDREAARKFLSKIFGYEYKKSYKSDLDDPQEVKSKLQYYLETDEGKKETVIFDLADRCSQQWRMLKRITRKSKKEYDSRPAMLRELDRQIDVRIDKMLLAKRKGTNEQFEVMRENFLEFFLALKEMVSCGTKWIKLISQIDWIEF